MRYSPLLLCVWLFATALSAGELQSSFPNYALRLLPDVPVDFKRLRAAGDDTTLPFSWDQVAVTHVGVDDTRQYHGYDPGPNGTSGAIDPIQIFIDPSVPVNVNVLGFDNTLGIQEIVAKANTAGLTEPFQFIVLARGIQSLPSTFTYNIYALTTTLRGTPIINRSPPDVIQPGQMVRYVWNSVNPNRFDNYEAVLTGKTSVAKGLTTSAITHVTGIKVIPAVLGHYLMTVTPKDVRGAPPLGSMSNGQVFYCKFGTNNLPPVTDGCSADTFLPAVNQVINVAPNATDPQTGQTAFTNEDFEFGDGSTTVGVTGSAAHSYAQPGIYRVRCTVTSPENLTAVAEDSVLVGATVIQKMPFKFQKQIPAMEGGTGQTGVDTFQGAFIDPSLTKFKKGDRLVFVYNRNQFGRNSASDSADEADIVLNGSLSFTGSSRLANIVKVQASANVVSINVSAAQLDRTGDPRLGRCELSGVFTNQRIAVAVTPADGSTPRVLLYNGNMSVKVRGGGYSPGVYIPEVFCSGNSTSKLPTPLQLLP